MPDCETKPGKNMFPIFRKSTRWRETVNLYRSSATIHGIAKTGEKQFYNYRPIIWILLTLAMAVFLIIMLYLQLARYFTYPTLTQINAVFNSKLDFPAATICNLNMFRKSIVNCSGPDFEYLYYETFEEMSDVSVLESFIKFGQPYARQGDVTGEELKNCLEKYSYKLELMLGYCVWEGTLKNCSDIFQKTTTEYGTCFTFNGKVVPRVSTRSSGSNAGLHIILNIQQDEYFFSKSLHAGVKVVLHEPHEDPFPASRGIYVGPGVAAAIAIRKEKTRALPYPYNKGSGSDYCLETDSVDFANPLTRYGGYSNMACVAECDINETVRACDCRHFLDPGSDVICSLLETQNCYQPELERSMMSRSYRENCSCPDTCTQTRYGTAVSYSKFGSDFVNDVLYQKGLLPDKDNEYVSNNFIDLRLYYDSLVVTETAQVPEITVQGILGSFGGLMGLFLGASLLSMSEVLELIVLLVCQQLRRPVKNDTKEDHTKTPESQLN